MTDSQPTPKRRPGIRLLKISAITVGSFYLLVLILFTALQNKLLFYPDRGLPPPPSQQVPELEIVTFNASDGVRLVSWWMPPKPGKPTVLFFHGNAGNISDRGDRLFDCRENGWGLLLLGYRGYGDSAGSPDEPGLYLDARATLAWVRARPEVDKSKLVYYGESLGCSVAMELAVAEPPLCVVLEAPFASLKAIARVHYPWLPTSMLLRSTMDNLAIAPKLKSPLFIAHGLCDEVVPFKQGKAVFDAAPDPKKFYELDCHHNDIPERGSKAYRAAVVEFVEASIK